MSRIFLAYDRLCALNDLYALNDEVVDPTRPIPAARNRMTLFAMTLSVLDDFGAAIGAAEAYPIAQFLHPDGRAVWKRVRGRRDRLKQSMVGYMRDKVGAHLAIDAALGQGVELFFAGQITERRIVAGSSPVVRDGCHPALQEAAFHGAWRSGVGGDTPFDGNAHVEALKAFVRFVAAEQLGLSQDLVELVRALTGHATTPT